MGRLTITEALAEIKTLKKRIHSKREFIAKHAARQEMFKDPLASDGGSRAVIERELQAVFDLEKNIVDIRVAIAKANLVTEATVLGQTLSLAEWLAWKRDIAPQKSRFYQDALKGVEAVRQEAARKGVAMIKDGQDARNTDIMVSIDEAKLAKQVENMENVLGTLDGQLSLKNATTVVEF